MSQVKNVKTRVLVFILALSMLFSSIANAGGGPIPTDPIDVNSTKYDMTIQYVDETGATIKDSETKTDAVTGAGKAYDEPAASVDGYAYVGYYVVGKGDITDLSTGNLYVLTDSTGGDASGGRGAYTIVAVYSVDENDNDIPDKNEKYEITEKFVDENGVSLALDVSFSVSGVKYNGTPQTIAGYDYLGYYYQGTDSSDATNAADSGGSLASPLSGDPYILMRSDSGEGSYDVTLVYTTNIDQWAKVTFDANNGTGDTKTQNVVKDVPTSLDENEFTYYGYDFEGWSTSASGSVDYLDKDSITTSSDVTLYAKWTEDWSLWSTITFHINYDGLDTTETQRVITGIPQTLRTNDFFARDGYVFLGWSEDDTATTETYSDGGDITVSGDTDLYAVWQRDDGQWSTITYHSNTPSGDETRTQSVVTGSSATLYDNTFTNPGYEFIGWSETASGDVDHAAGDTITVTGNMDLYAVWNEDSGQWATITYHINYDGLDTTETQRVIKDIPQTLKDNDFFSRPGYDFLGWSETPTTGTDVDYVDGDTITVSDDTNLYAVWEYNPDLWATITLYSNNGSGDTDTQDVVIGEPTALKSNAFVYAGFTFEGWVTDPSSDTVDYAENGIVTATGDMNLYAKWIDDDAQRATITYHINDKSGTDSTYPQPIIKGVSTTLFANEFVNPGYEFTGWSETPDGGVDYADVATVTFNDDTDLYAVWVKDDNQWATITYHNIYEGVHETHTQEVIIGISQTLDTLVETTFSRAGYLFGGWSTSSTSSTISYLDGGTITVSSDTDLYAVWNYDASQWATITYHLNNGSSTATSTQNVLKGETATLNPNTFENYGFLFDGWSYTADGSVALADRATVTISDDLDLYATWIKDPTLWTNITFYPNGADDVPYTQEVLIGSLTNLEANRFVYPGYTFVGWSTNSSSLSPEYANGAYIIPTGSMELYAVWRVDPDQWATITYHINNGTTGYFSTYTQSVIKGVEYPLEENHFEYEGRKFAGWSTTATGSKVYDDQELVTINDDLDLYAVWEIDEEAWVTITFHSNGGTWDEEMEPIKVLKGSTVTLTNSLYTSYTASDGTIYVFSGWSTDENAVIAGKEYEDGETIYGLDNDLDLYVIWGTPGFDLNAMKVSADKETAYKGDIVTWSLTVENIITPICTTGYDCVLTVQLPIDYLSYVDNSISVTVSGSSAIPSYVFDETSGLLTVYFSQMDPGVSYDISFQTIVIEDADATVNPTAEFRYEEVK